MKKFEYFEHTADIRFKAYGEDVNEAFENAVYAMFKTMSDDNVQEKVKKKFKVKGKDYESLLYNFLEEFLFLLDSKNFFVAKVKVKIKEPVKITYFVHGTTYDNEKNLFSGTNDVELSELGIRQSKELLNLISDRFDVVFCSDLKRAFDTANIAFSKKFKIIKDKRLRECNSGKFNGKSVVDFESIQNKYVNINFPLGESYKDVENRMANFIDFLKKNYAGKHIAIVAHQAPQLALDVLLTGKTWEKAFEEDWRKKKAWKPGWVYNTDFELEAEAVGDSVKKYETNLDVKAVTYNNMFVKKEKDKWVAQVVLDV